MIKKLVLALSLFTIFSTKALAQQPGEVIYSQNQFGGLVDEKYADDIGTINSPDLLNVYLDEYTGAVTKRKGKAKDNITAFTGNLAVKNLYDYKRINGDEFRVVQTSNSVLTTGGTGIYASVLSTESATARFDFTTAKNFLYGINGITVFKYDGTTQTSLNVTNSTGIPATATYIKYINNRMFYAGMAATPSQIWYSEINDPDNVQPLNYVLVNVSDGDYITGIFNSGGTIFVTKRYSTWQLAEVSVGVFQVSPVSLNIGCLYQSTMQTWQNYPVWLSHRGVELFDGQFNLISQPINNTMLSLKQSDLASYAWTQDTASDWGAGSGTNIDTTTYSGAVALLSYPATVTHTYGVGPIVIPQQGGARVRQSFKLPYTDSNFSLSNIKMYGQIDQGLPTPTIFVAISSNNMAVMVSTVVALTSKGIYPEIYDFPDFKFTQTLNANSTYYLYIATNTNAASWINTLGTVKGHLNSILSASESANYSGGAWAANTGGISISFQINYCSGSYTSQSFNDSNWSSWGSFLENRTIPANSSINHYVTVATSAYNLTTNAPIHLTNGDAINSTVGPYIQVISSFSRTVGTEVPRLYYMGANYYTGSTLPPCSAVYKDRYYLAVSTNTANKVNDMLLVYDRNGQWTRHTGNWGGACVYRGNLYSGDSTKGQVYLEEVKDLYTDDGNVYDSYYCTKMFDMREQDNSNTLRDKLWNEIWVRPNNEVTGTLDIDYRLDGSLGSFTNLYTYSLNEASNVSAQRFGLPNFTVSRFIQLRFRNNVASDRFSLKGFYLPFVPQPIW